MTRRCQGYFLAVLFAALLNAAGVLLSVGYAQVTTNITSSGLGTTVTDLRRDHDWWNITGGTGRRRGPICSIALVFKCWRRQYRELLQRGTCGVAQPLGDIKIFLVESPATKSPTYLGQYRRRVSARQICF